MSIHLILGPMYSGKSTELRRLLQRYTLAQKKVLAIKHTKDTRYHARDIMTHDNMRTEAVSVYKLESADVDAYDVIGIDEGQFFSDIEIIDRWALQGKVVIVAALDGDFARHPFGRIPHIIPLAESVTKLTAVCSRCGNNAAFTQRMTSEKSVEVIGSFGTYIAVCRGCYKSDNTPSSKDEVARKKEKTCVTV